MNVFDTILNGDSGLEPTDVPGLILGLLLAFAGGHVLAAVYMITHSGLSYSRSFVRSLVAMPIVVSLVMHVLANNIITAFGMMAVFTIVRFRNMLRDTLDTTYILLVLVLGMAAGSGKFTTALIGLMLMCSALLYLWVSAFGTRHRYDLIVNFHWSRPIEELDELTRMLELHARRSHLASHRISLERTGTDIAYWILLRDPDRVDELLTALRALNGVSGLTAIQAEEESEV
jgi:hypothetical protein